MNQQYRRANNCYIYIWKTDGKGFIYLENQAFSTVNLDDDSDFVQFLTSTDVQIRKYSLMCGFPWKNPSVNSQWYIKKMSALIWLRAYNHDFIL